MIEPRGLDLNPFRWAVLHHGKSEPRGFFFPASGRAVAHESRPYVGAPGKDACQAQRLPGGPRPSQVGNERGYTRLVSNDGMPQKSADARPPVANITPVFVSAERERTGLRQRRQSARQRWDTAAAGLGLGNRVYPYGRGEMRKADYCPLILKGGLRG